MTLALEGGEGSASRLGRSLPRGKTRYPLYRRLDGPQGPSWQVRKISPPPGFDPRTVQPVASRYTDCAIRSMGSTVLGFKLENISSTEVWTSLGQIWVWNFSEEWTMCHTPPACPGRDVIIACGLCVSWRRRSSGMLRIALLWAITQQVVVIPYRRFGKT